MVIEHGNKSSQNDGFELDLSQEHIEPMLQENLDRFVLFPIQQAEIWEMYKLHAASFWTAEEIDLAEDAKDWKTLATMSDISSSTFSLSLLPATVLLTRTWLPTLQTKYNGLRLVVSTASKL
jgi:hypothetical protein